MQQGGKNHTLIIEPLDNGGKITWNGKQILKDFPSMFTIPGFMRAIYNTTMSEHIDPGLKHLPIKMVHAVFPRMVVLTVNRWSKHIDATIQSEYGRLPGGQEGHCGNFNLASGDDTMELIMERTGALSAEGSLFPKPQPARDMRTAEKTLDDCSPTLKTKAKGLCQHAMQNERGTLPPGGGGNFLDACVFDVCFGGEEFAEEDAAIEFQAGEV